ncbi:MAG TPA: DUF1820 family protein [Nevskiaceae bacterium]|nr:DUF1820 family protein [Nevskiaceae bacterium]
MASAKHRLYRISFHNQSQVYELYAREVSHGSMVGFVEIGKLVFGEKSTVVVDTSEEKLKAEFENVERFYVPLHAVIRIDEVNRQGPVRILPGSGEAGAQPSTVSYPNFGGPRK